MLEKVDTLVIDKTGTLTEGKPRVTAVYAADGDENELLRLVASLEKGSEHPLGAAVVEAARLRGVALGQARDFDYVPGRGLKGTVEDEQVMAGNAALVGDISGISGQTSALGQKGETVIYVAVDGSVGRSYCDGRSY